MRLFNGTYPLRFNLKLQNFKYGRRDFNSGGFLDSNKI